MSTTSSAGARASTTMPDLDAAAYVDAAAAALDIPIEPEHRAAVIENFSRAGAAAALLFGLPLPDDIEPAPVFRP